MKKQILLILTIPIIVAIFLLIVFSCGNNKKEFRLDHIISDTLDKELPFVEENVNNTSEKASENNDIDEKFDTKIRYVKAISGLKMRDKPIIGGKFIAKIPFGESVTIKDEDEEELIIEDIKGKWTEVIWKDKVGWVFGGFLTETEISEVFITALNGLNMRKLPSVDGILITNIPYSSKVYIVEEKEEIEKINDVEGHWTQVIWKDKTGWVFGGYLGGRESISTPFEIVSENGGTAYSVFQTIDDGYISAGSDDDFYVLKLSNEGKREWETRFGGLRKDKATSIKQTLDNGYIIAGVSDSGDILPVKGDNSRFTDFYIVKTNSKGEKEWDAMYWGANETDDPDIIQTFDGGYMLVGTFWLDNIKPTKGFNISERDIYFLKLNSKGEKEWDAMYGGQDWDACNSNVIQTSDEGFIVAGYTMSSDIIPINGKNNVYVSDGLGSSGDFYILKIDSDGNKLWDTMYGGSGNDWASSIVQTYDDGFIIVGWTNSSDIKPKKGKNKTVGEFLSFNNDILIVKLDGSGKIEWEAMYGGYGNDEAYAISRAYDGGYILVGKSDSKDIKPKNGSNSATSNIYIIKLNENGEKEWDSMYGKQGEFDSFNCGFDILQTKDNGYLIGGRYLKNDFCLIKLRKDGVK